eukprot:TRINITY_DN3469_c0_g4_i3.p1 TRINITY_DN3469_c0_g4~~TRINITY_DN3469_c0_g4_i3.p1  ORF type:complete len:187 (-),score=55.90 TRINITY_DN3469_c0_g4_i3:12-572(-)
MMQRKGGNNEEVVEVMAMCREYVLGWILENEEILSYFEGHPFKLDDTSYEMGWDAQSNVCNFNVDLISHWNKRILINVSMGRKEKEEIIYPPCRHVWFIMQIRLVCDDNTIIDVIPPKNLRIITGAHHQYVFEEWKQGVVMATAIMKVAEGVPSKTILVEGEEEYDPFGPRNPDLELPPAFAKAGQ